MSWSLRQLPTSKDDGYGKRVQPLSALFDQSALPAEAREVRPVMVWFCSQEPDLKMTKRLFDDEDLVIASRYFDCVKIFVEDIESKADRERYAKTVPTLIFMDAGAKETGRISGQVGPNDILRQMNKAANAHFKKNLGDHVAKYAEFLKRFDKVDGKIGDTEAEKTSNEEHMVKHPCDRARKAIKECDEELVTLRGDREKLLAEEKGLLKVELKADPYAKPAAKESAKN